MLTGPAGVKIIPASSGIQELADLNPEQQISLVNALDHFDGDFDYLIIDTGAGISRNVMYFNAASNRSSWSPPPSPRPSQTRMRSSRCSGKHYGIKRFDLIVNNVTSKVEGITWRRN